MNTWDQRYASNDYFYGTQPNDFLRLCAPHLAVRSRILSLGEGEGRNASYLLQQGHQLVCVDGSSVARDKALKLCASHLSQLDYRVADLSTHPWEGEFDLVISIWCHLPSLLRKTVHKSALNALKPGGLLLLEAYRPEQIPLGTGGPKDVDMLLTPQIFIEEVPGLEMIIIQETFREVYEGEGHQGRSATLQVLARKPS